MTNNKMKKMVLTAMFLALAYVLPFLTGQIPQIGRMLLPMHLPVLVCGFVCGWPYGLFVGVVAPLVRSLTLTMPPFFPAAVAMAFELAAYGALTGLLYKKLPKKIGYIYFDLIAAMVGGRLVWGAAMLVLLGVQGNMLSPSMFYSSVIATAIPGIIVQLVLIPALIFALQKAKLIPLDKN